MAENERTVKIVHFKPGTNENSPNFFERFVHYSGKSKAGHEHICPNVF